MSVSSLLLRSRVVPLCQNCRPISTSAPCSGKRNFRKFLLYNKRGSRQFKKLRDEGALPDFSVDPRGVRPTGHFVGSKFQQIPEMIPELVVPDLDGFKLKPYVSYRAPDVVQTEFTPQDLFDAVYARKIVQDFKEGKLDENGEPLEPSEHELLKPEEAVRLARRTGSDLFNQEKGIDEKLKLYND